MKVGIIGSGLIGGKLGTFFARAGHEVTFSYSRSEEKLQALARDAGSRARHGTPADAVAGSDAVLLAVHWNRVREVLALAGPLEGTPLITCCLPMSDDDSALVLGHTTSGAEALQAMVPRAKVVSAFGTIPSEVLPGVFAARRRKARPSLLCCGDVDEAKAVAVELARDIGFDPIDLGPLRMARYLEPFTLAVAQLAYEGELGPAVAYRFEWFEEA